MSFLKEYGGSGKRPYPLDRDRRRRVMFALDEHAMNISALAKRLNLPVSLISMVISGRRLSVKTEQRIADFLGKPVDDLFPYRTPEEIKKMRQKESAAKQGNAA